MQQKGHMECIKYLCCSRCQWDEGSCSSASGNLECLRFLHENGCPWSEKTCINAVYNCNLYCLEYAHKNGFPYNKNYLLKTIKRQSNKNVKIYYRKYVIVHSRCFD